MMVLALIVIAWCVMSVPVALATAAFIGGAPRRRAESSLSALTDELLTRRAA